MIEVLFLAVDPAHGNRKSQIVADWQFSGTSLNNPVIGEVSVSCETDKSQQLRQRLDQRVFQIKASSRGMVTSQNVSKSHVLAQSQRS